MTYILPLPEYVMECINEGKTIPETSEAAKEWLEITQLRNWIRNGMPIGSFRFTISHERLDRDMLDYILDIDIPELSGRWLWDSRAIPYMESPTIDANGRAYWPKPRGTATYQIPKDKGHV